MRHPSFFGLGFRLLIMVLIAAISVLDLFASFFIDPSLKPAVITKQFRFLSVLPVHLPSRRGVKLLRVEGRILRSISVSAAMMGFAGFIPLGGSSLPAQATSGGTAVGLGIVAALVIIILGWLWLRWSRKRDLEALTLAVQRMADGDLSTRAPRGNVETAGLTNALNRLAETAGQKISGVQRDGEKFRGLVEHIPTVSYVGEINDEKTDLFISPQVEDMLGYRAEEIVQFPRLWAEAIHPDDRERVMVDLTHIEAGVPWTLEFRMIRRDGKMIWCRDQGIAIRDDQGETARLYGTLSDITEVKDLMDTLHNERDIFDRVVDTSQVGIVLVDTEGKIVNRNHHAQIILGQETNDRNLRINPEELDIRDENDNPIPRGKLPFDDVLETKKPIYGVQISVKDADDPERGRKFISINASPYVDLTGQIIGVVVTLEDISELQKQRLQMEALVKTTAALRNAMDREEMYTIALSQIIDLANVDGASIVTIDPLNNEYVFELGLGNSAPLTGRRISTDTGITAQVISSGNSYLNNDMKNDPNLYKLGGFVTGELSSGACVPLQTQDQIIGAIWAVKNGAIQEKDMDVLLAIGEITANSIYRASLIEQTQARLRRLSALHTIDVAITSSLDIRVTLSILLDQIMNQMSVDAVSILLLNTETKMLEYAAGRGFSTSKPLQTQVRLGEAYAGQVALTRQPILISDVFKKTGQVFPLENESFMAYFAEPLLAKGQVKGVIELFNREPLIPDQEWIDFFHALATQAAIAIDNLELFNRLQRTNDELTLAYDATIEGWARALELRDRETQGHSNRVTDLTLMIAQKLGVKGMELSDYRRGVLLHDIGKMAIPDEILLKPGPLSPEEWEIMRMHPRYAYELLSPVPYLRRAVDIPYCHHEKWDGSGYPRGLKRDAIPFSARIFSVVDVWDALRSDRPYRDAWTEEQTQQYIRSKAGVQFDPRIVSSFFEIIDHRYN